MKTFNIFVLLTSFTLVLSSCSTNETFLPEEQPQDLLKTYIIKRDATGAYSLEYDVNNNTTTENYLDRKTNTSKIYLYSLDNQSAKKVTQDLTIDGEQLKVGFVDVNSNESSSITIIDDNLVVAKKRAENSRLNDYSISSNLDGTYTLKFDVKDGVAVDFVYNEEIKTYEIHLEKGNAKSTSFSRTLEKEDGEPLKFDFVDHGPENQSRSESSYYPRRKPRGVVI